MELYPPFTIYLPFIYLDYIHPYSKKNLKPFQKIKQANSN